MTSVFLTGFPGFLGSQLAPRLLGRYGQGVAITCLVQVHYRQLAEQRVRELEARDHAWAGRLHLIEGDITLADLGLGAAYDRLAGETAEIYHLGAIYDLGVALDPAMRVNVDGTANMLAFAQACGSRLERFHYVSTCYVSGRYEGMFTEDDLVCGQTFANQYELTKYLAELEVQAQMARGLPATIYRPGVVVGDSRTGATQKFDGVYNYIQWLLRFPNLALLPDVGGGSKVRTNIVPQDFVVDAIAYLSALEATKGKVYQLCDPSPLTVDETIEVLARVTGARIIRPRLPFGVVRRAFDVPIVERWVGIVPEAIDHLVLPTTYSCEHTLHDLAGSGIACPPFAEYAANLVEFMREHPEVSAEAMV